jgi:CopG family nickel-responsive transcriptional regulator
MAGSFSSGKTGVSRISISLPETLLRQLDKMVDDRGFESRSRAIADMITRQLAEHHADVGEEIMAGTITLVYDHSVPGLQKELADIQHRHINEVISSLHVQLVQPRTMEVLLVQGPAIVLQRILDRLVTCRGVLTGKLQLTAALMPPLHPLPVSAQA